MQRSNGATPLHLAAKSGQAAVTRTLIAAGADLEAHTDRIATPIFCAAIFGTLEVVQVLIDAGADIHFTSGDGATVLHMAAANSNEPGLIPCLLAAGAGCQLNSHHSHALFTPLMAACSNGIAPAVEHLLEAGAALEARTDGGATALHRACANGHREIVELLIAAGADAEAVTDSGTNPIGSAAIGGCNSVVALLQEKKGRLALGQSGEIGSGIRLSAPCCSQPFELSACREEPVPSSEPAAPAAPRRPKPLRTCGPCGRQERGMLQCGRCRAAWFCGVDCQRAAWPVRAAAPG